MLPAVSKIVAVLVFATIQIFQNVQQKNYGVTYINENSILGTFFICTVNHFFISNWHFKRD